MMRVTLAVARRVVQSLLMLLLLLFVINEMKGENDYKHELDLSVETSNCEVSRVRGR